MKRLLTFSALLLLTVSLKSQVAPDKYWVQFTDKNNTPYSINRPEDFLSERALQRRRDYGIEVDESDIPCNPSYIKAIAQKGANVLNVSKWLNGVTVETSDISVINEIKQLPFVKNTRTLYDEPLKQMLKMDDIDEEIITGEDMLDMRNFYGSAYKQIEQLNGAALHELGYQGQGMWIGICDSGYDGADVHAAFDKMREDGRLLGTRDFVYKNGNVYSDDHHGTACLGLMAGYIPNKYVGTAPMASYFLCRTENVNSENIIEEYNWVSAAEFLDSLGVDVISTSLGYISFDNEQMTHDYMDLDGKTCVITRGAEMACSKGILCVNAAGNEGDNPFPYIGAPSDGKNVLTVGAVKANGERAYFSSIGPTYDGRIKPDVMACGYDVTVASPNNNFYEGNGTSFAAPVLAGMSACLWQANKNEPAGRIREMIKKTGNYYSNPNNDYGYGIPDFMSAYEMLNVEEYDTFEEKTFVSIYPNPSDGIVNMDVNTMEKFVIQVFNVLGELVYVGDSQFNTINEMKSCLSDLYKGVYLVKIEAEDKSQSVKLIKY